MQWIYYIIGLLYDHLWSEKSKKRACSCWMYWMRLTGASCSWKSKGKKKRTLQPSTVSPSCLIFISDWEHIVVVPIINKRRAHTPSVFCFCGAQFRVNADLFGCSTLKGQCVYLSVWRTASPQNQRQQALPKVRELSIVWIMLFMWKICPWIHNERQTCCLSSLIIIPH